MYIQHCDKYLTHPTNSPKPHLLLSLHSSFIPNLKHCSLTNPILIHPLLPTSLPISTPNTIHRSRLTVCLLNSLNLIRCLTILFWISACDSGDFAFVGAVEISSLRLRLSSYPDVNFVLRPSSSIMLMQTTFSSVTVVVVCHSI